MQPQSTLALAALCVFLLAFILYGRSAIRRRRDEEDLAPYRARAEDRLRRRQLEREEQRFRKQVERRTRKSSTDWKTARTGAMGDDGGADEELMQRLSKLRPPHGSASRD